MVAKRARLPKPRDHVQARENTIMANFVDVAAYTGIPLKKGRTREEKRKEIRTVERNH